MSFRLSDEAREYFDDIESRSTTGEFEYMWDKYYLAAMIGIKARDRVKTEEEPSETPFLDAVVGNYENRKYEIYATLIMAETRRKGVSTENESDAEIREIMLQILDSSDPTRLSTHGKTLLNCYAERGFHLLRDRVPIPGDFDQFLEQYRTTLGEV